MSARQYGNAGTRILPAPATAGERPMQESTLAAGIRRFRCMEAAVREGELRKAKSGVGKYRNDMAGFFECEVCLWLSSLR